MRWVVLLEPAKDTAHRQAFATIDNSVFGMPLQHLFTIQHKVEHLGMRWLPTSIFFSSFVLSLKCWRTLCTFTTGRRKTESNLYTLSRRRRDGVFSSADILFYDLLSASLLRHSIAKVNFALLIWLKRKLDLQRVYYRSAILK